MREDDCWAECEKCQKLMCDECRNKVDCHVCQEKLDQDCDIDIPDICQECMKSCEACGGICFHPGCKAEHRETCNRQGRAQRAVAAAKAAVEDSESKVQQTKRKLAKQEAELTAAKKAKVKAVKKLQELKP